MRRLGLLLTLTLVFAFGGTWPAHTGEIGPVYAPDPPTTYVELVWELIDQSGSTAALRCGMSAELHFSGTSSPAGTLSMNSATATVDCGGARGGVTPSRVCAAARLQSRYPTLEPVYRDQGQEKNCAAGGTAAANSGTQRCYPCGGYEYRAVGDIDIAVPSYYVVYRPNGRCTPPDSNNNLFCRIITGTVYYR